MGLTGASGTGFVKPREIEHDAGVSELVLETVDRVRSLGGRVRSVRLEAELKAAVARAGRKGLDPAAARLGAARAAGVPVDEDGVCHFPDAVVEVTDAGGAESTLALELVTGSYSRRPGRAEDADGHGPSRPAVAGWCRSPGRSCPATQAAASGGPGGRARSSRSVCSDVMR